MRYGDIKVFQLKRQVDTPLSEEDLEVLQITLARDLAFTNPASKMLFVVVPVYKTGKGPRGGTFHLMDLHRLKFKVDTMPNSIRHTIAQKFLAEQDTWIIWDGRVTTAGEIMRSGKLPAIFTQKDKPILYDAAGDKVESGLA